jgi:hypothetical protein
MEDAMTTRTWTADELTTIGDADEIDISSRRPDGSLRPFITIWAVRGGDDLFVRSAYGPDNGWYRHAKAAGAGRIRAGGQEWDVTFVAPDHAVDEVLHAAYHAKYDQYGAKVVDPVVSPTSAQATLRLVAVESTD